MTRLDDIRTRLTQVQARIAAAEQAGGRAEGSVQLLPVTKFHPASDIALLHELGITAVGENREQEARDKAAELPDVHVHMIGQVQTKKANSVARWASACHAVDSTKLVDALERGMALALERGDRTSEEMDCFIQFSADGDTSRGGAVQDDIAAIAEAIDAAEHLRLAGLMVVPPIDDDAGEVFARSRALVDTLGEGMLLSAGMSGDMEAAIAAGSNIVRVGTDILGDRPLA